MRPERLIYTFVSYASSIDAHWGHGTPEEGVEHTAKIAHKHGIPVTWLVNSGSVQVLKDRINQWHEQYGDDVILHCPPYPNSPSRKYIKKALVKDFEIEWNILKEAFPWAHTKVAGTGFICDELIQALEELDFKGIWGYCWEQSWWDSITHKGIPWGFWYVDANRYKAPHPSAGKVIGCEWTARDLNLAYHTSAPCIYSTDPNDVLRAGLCTGDNIDYWKKLFNDYISNTDNNEAVYFLQHQEAHEMEVSDRFAVYRFSHVEACTQMLDNFFAYIKSFNVTLKSLPDAVKSYHENNSKTAPCYMLTEDSSIRPELNSYNITLGGVGMGPWPKTFLYYDEQCQMAFLNGECKPRMLRSYVGNASLEGDFTENVPAVFVEKYRKTDGRIEMTFKVGYTRPIPFGVTYWDDLSGYTIKECTDVTDAKIIRNQLAFLRFNLTGEIKYVKLVLEKS